jgi:hypothetical protein
LTDLVAAALSLSDALERAGIPYALGGALALNFWSDPRGTRDIDLNVFLPADDSAEAFEVLRRAGVQLDVVESVARAHERGDAIGWLGPIRVDVFVNSLPLHDSAARRRCRVTLSGQPIWILSAEDLSVLKLLFFRGKDIEDSKRMIALQGKDFDSNYARTQLVAHVGADDARVAEFDRIVAVLARPPRSPP